MGVWRKPGTLRCAKEAREERLSCLLAEALIAASVISIRCCKCSFHGCSCMWWWRGDASEGVSTLCHRSWFSHVCLLDRPSVEVKGHIIQDSVRRLWPTWLFQFHVYRFFFRVRGGGVVKMLPAYTCLACLAACYSFKLYREGQVWTRQEGSETNRAREASSSPRSVSCAQSTSKPRAGATNEGEAHILRPRARRGGHRHCRSADRNKPEESGSGANETLLCCWQKTHFPKRWMREFNKQFSTGSLAWQKLCCVSGADTPHHTCRAHLDELDWTI